LNHKKNISRGFQRGSPTRIATPKPFQKVSSLILTIQESWRTVTASLLGKTFHVFNSIYHGSPWSSLHETVNTESQKGYFSLPFPESQKFPLGFMEHF